MTCVLATHNPKKKAELARILAPLGWEVLCEADLDAPLPDVEETEDTFEGNAFLKAASACRATGSMAVADDSGLCVDALDGAPGVHSARYGERPDWTDADRTAHLLQNLQNVPDERRTARFVSVVCCVLPDGRSRTWRGECEGIIAHAPRGENGFGYDPVFLVGDKTFAELSAAEKDAVSHRGNAVRALADALKRFI